MKTVVAFLCVGLFGGDLSSGLPLHLVAPYLPSNPNIVEAGAHIGDDTVGMSKYWPESKIYAFEPSPDVFPQLIERTKDNPRIKIWQIALGRHVGVVDFYSSYHSAKPEASWGYDASGSLFEPNEMHNWEEFGFKKIQVPCTTLDIWANEQGIRHVDFMWLDMQGGELDMMKASPQIMKTVRVIQTEISRVALYKNAPLYDEFMSWMTNSGFELIHLYDNGLECDAVFVRN